MTHLHTPGAATVAGAQRTAAMHHVSWGAIFAGLVMAVALQITLTVLGAAIGLTALDGADSGRAFGIGAAIWAVLVPLVTLYVGGMVAGRTAHLHSNRDALLHGALVWAMSLLLAAWLLGTGASRILGSTLNFVGNTASGALAGAGAAASRSDITPEAARNAAADAGLTQEQAQQRVDQAQTQAARAADQVQGAAAGSAWAALLALALSLLAAVFGSRSTVHDAHHEHRTL